MSDVAYFVSCDWGTSNFRLRLVETNTLSVLAQHQTSMGIKLLNDQFLKQTNQNRETFFLSYLHSQLEVLGSAAKTYPVIAAGMITSNIGLYELDYANLPFSGSGTELNIHRLKSNEGLTVLLISGVRGDNGMMRGEEVQAIGLEEFFTSFKQVTLLLPGTHSKHIRYESNLFCDFKTYMTGELFSLLTQHSILKTSVEKSSLDQSTLSSFQEGVKLGFEKGGAESLFSVRAKDVLNKQISEMNYNYLSGILIGDELSHLKKTKDKIVLAAADPIFSSYATALKYLIPEDQLLLLNGEKLEKAFLKGQLKMIKFYEGF